MRASAFAAARGETPLFDSAHRWLPALFVLAGLRVVQRPVAHWPRRPATSKYTTRGRLRPIVRETGHGRSAWCYTLAAAPCLRRRRGDRSRSTALPYLYAAGTLAADRARRGSQRRGVARDARAGQLGRPAFQPDRRISTSRRCCTGSSRGSFTVLGVDEFAARLPSALSAVAMVALTCGHGAPADWARRARCFAAAVIVATAPLMLVFARLVIFDMPFTAFVTLALYCLVRARLDGGAGWLVPGAGLAMASRDAHQGTGRARGAAARVVRRTRGASAAAGAHVSERRAARRPALRGGWWAPGSTLVLRHQQDFLRYALVDETFLRFTSVERFHRGAPVYFYPLTFAWALAPWSVLMVAMLPEFARCWRRADEERRGPALRHPCRRRHDRLLHALGVETAPVHAAGGGAARDRLLDRDRPESATSRRRGGPHWCRRGAVRGSARCGRRARPAPGGIRSRGGLGRRPDDRGLPVRWLGPARARVRDGSARGRRSPVRRCSHLRPQSSASAPSPRGRTRGRRAAWPRCCRRTRTWSPSSSFAPACRSTCGGRFPCTAGRPES